MKRMSSVSTSPYTMGLSETPDTIPHEIWNPYSDRMDDKTRHIRNGFSFSPCPRHTLGNECGPQVYILLLSRLKGDSRDPPAVDEGLSGWVTFSGFSPGQTTENQIHRAFDFRLPVFLKRGNAFSRRSFIVILH